jgi:hypothetical protein
VSLAKACEALVAVKEYEALIEVSLAKACEALVAVEA